MSRLSALISGASIAGPVVAFWLSEAGWDVTVVERAARLRMSGYPVDIRGAAVEVVRRMGLYDRIMMRSYQHVPITILSERGCRVGTMELGKPTADGDVEINRGVLSDLLYQASRERARYVFGESVTSLARSDTGVEVTFRDGPPRTFDAVIGADGMHSHIRGLTFGDESQFIHHLGPCVAVWDARDAGVVSAGTGVVHSHAGRSVLIERPVGGSAATAFMTFNHPAPGSVNRHDTAEVVRTLRAAFAEDRWRSAEIIDTLSCAEDLYFDTVSQVRMSRWSSGRVALVGDGAYAPSFLSGRSTSFAIAGAYLLASELARTARPQDAFAAYEGRLRRHVVTTQDAALRTGPATAKRHRKRVPRAVELSFESTDLRRTVR